MKLLLILCALANAREVLVNKKVNIERLETELRAASFLVTHSDCAEESCVITMPDSEKKDPASIIAAHTYVDPRLAKQAMLDELAAIEAAIDAGNETAAQRRRFMKIVLKLTGLSSRP